MGKAAAIRRLGGAAAVVALACVLSCGGGEEEGKPGEQAAAPIRIMINPSGPSGVIMPELIADFQEETGIAAEVVRGPENASSLYTQYQMLLGGRSESVDVYLIDVIWPGALANHLADVGPIIEGDRDDYFDYALDTNTVDGRLVGVPFYGDIGLLFYRRDLLEKYGFAGPPQTWDELEQMAATIQEGERAAGNADFWGFVWQGDDREALTCNAMEWQKSHGGGPLVADDRTVSIDPEGAAAAFDRAAGWISTITPPAVVEFAEHESFDVYASGNAAFMRNWAIFLDQLRRKSPELLPVTELAPLPGGPAGRAATIGGWQLAISRYSTQPGPAARLVRWLTSPRILERRAIQATYLPLRRSVYQSDALREQAPWMLQVLDAFEAGNPRPSTPTRELYNEISTLYYATVHEVLIGRISGMQAVRELQAELPGMLE